ncbi:MAG TPA: hydantoinase B/oxoprolinase family protein [Stellaceae bacterium]|nr:hydantoinase B/oxoprolinase family protein [Stellaceae bacterium]
MTGQRAKLGPIELEILRSALTAVANEMDVTVWRTSRSTIVRELLDYSTAVFDRDGFNVTQSARIPQHLNSMGFGFRTIVERFLPLDQWRDGDVVISNDPYCGGQHLPDLLAFRPVFANGERVAVVGTLCHHLDMGGLAAGSYAATATEIFQEGIRIPPLRLYEGGVLNEAVLALVKQNVRKPELFWGDLQAQLASLAVGETKMQALISRYGARTVVSACAEILDSSERAMRAMIRALPDGHYAFEDFIDDDGIEDRPIRVHAAIDIKGDEMTVDLSGSGPQAIGPVNATLASAASAVCYSVIACADEAVAANAGCYRPIKLVAPEGTVVNARHPAPVAHRMVTSHRLCNVLLGALHKAAPDRIPAAYYGVSYTCTFQSIDETGERRVLVEIEIGGGGGYPTEDGANAYSLGMHNNANIPVEMIESERHISVTRYGLIPDSGGAGRYRGGLGLSREWRIDCAEALFTASLERFKFRPYGLAGGGPGSAGSLTLIRGNERKALPSKVNNLRLRQGDIIRLETSGGGGFGAPADRPSAERERDARLGYVTADAAERAYRGTRPCTPSLGALQPRLGLSPSPGSPPLESAKLTFVWRLGCS